MTRTRSILGGSLGNLVEWFDWYVYSAFSLYFAKAFFPHGDQTAQFLGTSGIFWIGFMMRPVGGWLMGRLADRRGRRTALAWSVAMMCGGSLLIACVPTYADVGIAAPLFLVVARMIQGLSVGGEYGASATYLTEMAPPAHRGFWSSFQYVTLIMGQLLALLLLLLLQFVILDEAALDAWGWRIPFVVGAGLAIVTFHLRRGIAESPAFVAEGTAARTGGRVAELLRDHRRAFLTALGIAIGSNVAFYTYTTYMQKYLVASAGFAKGTASLICTLALALFMLAQPAAAALSDRIGRKPLLYWFGAAGMLATVPLMTAIGATRDPATAFWLVLAALLIVTGTTATAAVVKAELFPAHIRALGVGLPYALSQAVFGGSAEPLALWLKSIGHESWFFYYVSVCVGVSLLTYLQMPETRWTSAMAEADRD